MCTVFWGTTWLVFCSGCTIKRCWFRSVLLQVGFLGRRCWNRVWGARYLSGMHTCERKEEASLGKRKSQFPCRFNSLGQPQRGPWSKYYPSEWPALSPNCWACLTSLPYSVFGYGLLQEWCVSWRGLCLQLSPTLEEVTAKHQMLSRSGWYIPMLLKTSSK